MPRLRPLSRRGAALALALFASLLSCGREVTGPGGRGALVALQIAPDLSSMIEEVDGVMHSVAALVPFTKVRVELRRVDNTVAAAEVVQFPENATEIPLSITVRLGDAAVNGAEPLTLFIRYINATGDTVFAGGPLAVTAKTVKRGEEPQTVEVPVAPTVPGAIFARVDISPDTVIASTGQTANFTATGYDAQDVVVPDAIIGFISRNPALVAVPSLGSGSVNLVGVRGSTWLIAQSLTGVKDSAFIQVLPVPTALAKVSGDAQSALTEAQFAQPLRVRVTAADGIGVANWPVDFAVAAGGGSLSASKDTTDANGFAEVLWTAGASAGPGSVTASVAVNALTTTFTGSQLSSAPTTLVFQTQPTNITAGATLPDIKVEVRNGAGEVITDFEGVVALTLNSGATGAELVGEDQVAAVAGIATFSQLTVNKGGAGFKLAASYGQLPPVQSNAFNVAAAPPTAIAILGGASQSAPPSATLADSIRVRVTDTFGFAVAGQSVQFTVAQGGGTVSAPTVVTDADGRAAVTWTLGAIGVQQLRVSLGALEEFVGATIVTGGSVQLFAGLDYADVRTGGSRLVPIYLTNPSPTPLDVTLSVHDTATAYFAWEAASVQIPAGVTRVDVRLDGLAVGGGWAVMQSQAGNDSVLVAVDSGGVSFVQAYGYGTLEGDTATLFVQLSEPAPAGGLTVVVRSDNPSVVQLAPGSGDLIPEPGCLGSYCNAGASAEVSVAPMPRVQLRDTPADTAAIFIPEGHVFGELAVVSVDDLGEGTQVTLTAEATGFVSGSTAWYISTQYISHYLNYSSDPSLGVGVGQQLSAEFYLSTARPREQRIHLESSNPAVVVVDSVAIVPADAYYAVPAIVRVIGLDSAYLRFWMDNVPADSVLIVGAASKLQLGGYNYVPEAGAVELTVRLAATTNEYAEYATSAPVAVTVVSEDPAIIAVDRASVTLLPGESSVALPIRAVGAGTTNLIVSAPGYAPDTLSVSTYLSSIYTSSAGIVGVGQFLNVYTELDYSVVETGSRTVNVVSLTPGVLDVVTPRLEFERGVPGTQLYLRGVAPGTATIELSGPSLTPVQFQVQVQQPLPSMFVSSNLSPDGLLRNAITALQVNGTVLPVADTSYAVLRTSDPNVVALVDSVVVFAPENSGGVGGTFRPVAPGNALVSLIRPNGDSIGTSVSVMPYTIVPSWSSVVVGNQLEAPFSLYREGPDTLGLPITINQSGPGVVSFRAFSAAFANGEFVTEGRMVGESYGVDTLTITVPGYPSVSQVVYVESTTVSLPYGNDDGWVAGTTIPYIYSFFNVTGVPGTAIAGKPLRLLVASLDTSRIDVAQDTIEWAPGDAYYPSRYATLHFKQVGLASIAVSDLDGVLPGDTVETFIYPADLSGSVSYSGDAIAIGMGQRTDIEETWVSRGAYDVNPLWVHLSSSNPTIVQVPDSVLIPSDSYYGYFDVTAGDTTGSARVTATAVGYNPWHFDVLVTRPLFNLYVSDTHTDGGGVAEVYVTDAVTSTSRPLTAPAMARFSSDESGFFDLSAPTFTMPADSYYIEIRGPKGLKPGQALLRVEDDGPERFARIGTGSYQTEIETARVIAERPRLLLTPGVVTENDESMFSVATARDSLWIRLQAVGDKFAPVVDSVFAQRSIWYDEEYVAQIASDPMPLRGLAFGTDTLVLSADDLLPDTILVSVEPGVLRSAGPVPNIVVGDSLLIAISINDAAGAPAAAAESLNLAVSVDTTFTARLGGASISTLPVAPGQSTIQLWVRAESTGPAQLSISDARFRTFILNLNAVERP